MLYPYLGKQVGGEGVNLTALVSLAALVVLIGGWLLWVGGVGGKRMPSLRENLTATAFAQTPTLNMGALFTAQFETPFNYGVNPVVNRATSVPDLLTIEEQIEGTRQMLLFCGEDNCGGMVTPVPTNTRFPWECNPTPSVEDWCYKQSVELGGEAGGVEYWIRRTLDARPFDTPIPTQRTFITWTPTAAAPRTAERSALLGGSTATVEATEAIGAR